MSEEVELKKLRDILDSIDDEVLKLLNKRMLTVNKDVYLKQRADSKILNNVTKYCTECYKELQENKLIYFDIKNYR